MQKDTYVTKSHVLKGHAHDAEGKMVGFECGVCGAVFNHDTVAECIEREEPISYTGYRMK